MILEIGKNYVVKHKEVFIILLFALGFFHKLIIHTDQMIYPASDIKNMYSFWRSFLVDSYFKYHEFPLWNPYMFSGMPFVGDTQSGMFYPFTLLFYFFPINLVFGYTFIIDFFLLGFFTYLFARQIGLEKFSSLVSSISMMLSGNFVLLIYEGHLFIADTIIWFPLILLLYELALIKKQLIFAIISGIPLSFMVLAGHIQPAVFGFLASLGYLSLRFIVDYKTYKKHILRIMLIPFLSFIIAVLISSIQILPSLQLSELSIRSGGLSYEFASDFSLPPKQLLSFLLPHFFGSPLNQTYWGKGNFWSLSAYAGILPLIFTAIAIIFKRDKYALIFALLGLFALFFSFGPHSPLFPFFYKHIPGFNMFRVPARFLYVYGFSISILAGIGVNFFFNRQNGKTIKRIKKFLFFLSMISLFTISFILLLNFRSDKVALFEKYVLKNSYAVGLDRSILYLQLQNDLIVFSIFIVISIVLIRLLMKYGASSLIKITIITFIAIDLGLFGMKFYTTGDPTYVFTTPEIIKKVKLDKDRFRVFDLSGKFVTPLSINSIESLTGINSSYLKHYQEFVWLTGDHLKTPYENFLDFYNIKNPTILKMLNVKYIISKNKLPNKEYINIYKKDYYLYKDRNTLPRAYIVNAAKVIPNKKEIFKILQSKNYKPKEYVMLEIDPKVPLKNGEGFRSVYFNLYEPDKIKLKTNFSSPAYLVLSEIWYPGWKAYDNGLETEIFKTNYVFRSIYVKKGLHDISFVYDPDSYKVGKAISILSLLTVIGSLVYINKRSSIGKY